MQMCVICVADSPARVICRCVPSPGSKRMPSSSHCRKRALWLRARVGTWLAVPRKVTIRLDMARVPPQPVEAIGWRLLIIGPAAALVYGRGAILLRQKGKTGIAYEQ